MENNKPNPFTFDVKELIIEEIALEGLEGIGINLLWKRLGARISAPVTEKMKTRFWSFIANCKSISAYRVPEPVLDIEIVDRLTIVDEETGYLMDPEDYLDGPYEYFPAEDNSGSCLHYKTRSLVSDDITSKSYGEVVAEYSSTLVLVASLEERWKALSPDLPISVLPQLGPLNFCMLELIGRARYNGQMTTGTTNLTKIVKDPKILFYHRKALQNLDLVRVTSVTQVTAGRSVKSLLIRLKKFHKSDILTVPKSGVIRKLVDYLQDQPNFCEKTEIVIKKGLMTPAQNKKFQKKVSLFHFEEEPVSSDLVLTNSKDSDCPKKHIRKRYMCLLSKSDESSQSEDDEEVSQPLKCQYKIGVNVLRQAYERFLEAGRNGLTQQELTQLVGLEFYIGRTICRIFKTRNIIREFVECKGRQRMGRFIAIAATSRMDSKLAEEKEKFQKLLDEGDRLCKRKKRTLSESSSDSETLIAKKKRKMESSDTKTAKLGITEVKHIEGVRNPEDKKINLESKMSLRQLKFVNGILKIVHEKTFVQGYHTLSNLVAAECKEPPMDTKAMKLLLQGMVSTGNLKIYNIKFKHTQYQYIVLICAPHINRNDPILQTRYKELLHKSNMSQKIAKKRTTNHMKPLTEYAYPRYVKVQKLHEALIDIMYFSNVKSEPSDLPHGFLSLKNLIPVLPIEVALGHITSESVIDVSKFTIDDSLLNVKVRDAPPDLYRALLKSKSLQSSLRSILKILAHFGLVQLVVQPTTDNDEILDNSMAINLFYVNKCAKILDTSGVWPKKKPFNIEDLEREFNFEKLGAAKEYWQAVYHISTNTTVEVLNRRQKHVKIKPPIRTITQALKLDNGQRFGNGLGPCGFDSLYYLDIPRLWKAYCIRTNSMKSKSNSGSVKIPKFEIPKRKIQKKKVAVKKPKVEIPKAPPPSVKLGVKNKKRIRTGQTWSSNEDRLLMICKTAITIMSPISQPGCLRVRNLVAKDILSINDPKKTQSVCHKRAATIETNSTLMHERNCILNELRRHDVISKYEGLLKKVRILYSTNMSKYINEARKLMMELVWIIYEVSKSLPLLQEIPSIAINYDEFHKKYMITASASSNQSTNFYKMPHDSEVNVALKEAILLSVILSYENNIDKKSAEIIYSYFSKFSESDLRKAIEPLRKCGAIAARDKVIRSHLHIVDLDDLTQSSYKISAFYQRKWISRLNSDFVDNLYDSFNGDTNQDAIKASPETNCFCFEQQANDTLDIVTVTVPVITGPSGSIIQEEQLNVIDIATNFKLKSGTIGWKNKTNLNSYSCLYEDIKVKDVFEYLTSQSFISDEDIRKEYTDMRNHSIVSYLMTKREKGSTFNELQESLNLERKTLIEELSKLQAENIIKRVGYYDNVLVLIQHVKPWCMAVPGGFIIPEPWLTFDTQIRPNIFFQWAGVVMNKVFENPGCSLSYLSGTSEFLTVRATQHICEMLQKSKCISLHTLLFKEPSLFSNVDDDLSSEFCDYNEFESPRFIIAVPTKDCLSKYSYLKKNIKF